MDADDDDARVFRGGVMCCGAAQQNGPDTNYDLGLLRWGLRTLLWISEEHPHGLAPAPLAGRWRDTLTRLAPYPQDPAKGYHIAQGVPLTVRRQPHSRSHKSADVEAGALSEQNCREQSWWMMAHLRPCPFPRGL